MVFRKVLQLLVYLILLFLALSDSVKREVIKQAILERYFSQCKSYDICAYETSIKNEMVYDASESYARKVKMNLGEVPKELHEQEIVVRSHIFRKAISDDYTILLHKQVKDLNSNIKQFENST